MTNFYEVVRSRRSADKFIEGIRIPKEDFNEIFKDLSLAPSAFNLQHTKYYVVEDKKVNEEVYEAGFKQHKIKTASATIIITGNKNAYKGADKIYEGSLMLGILQQFEYDYVLEMINKLYEGWGESFRHDEAIRNASLSAMQFMLLSKAKGWDTCPMNYFDKDKIKNILDLPEEEVPVLIVTMGKSDEDSKKLRGFRKPIGEYTKFI